jgi:hypothetical protein
MDSLAKKLINEIDIDLSPYQTFKALRLSVAHWDVRKDVNLLITELNESVLLNDALDNTAVIKNAESQEEENLIYMKCDYLLTRLKLAADDEQVRSMLKIANVLNQPRT